MTQNLNQILPVQNWTERQEILKQAFLTSKSGSIKDIYATARKICAQKKWLKPYKRHAKLTKNSFNDTIG